jgi:hypothetical protein
MDGGASTCKTKHGKICSIKAKACKGTFEGTVSVSSIGSAINLSKKNLLALNSALS